MFRKITAMLLTSALVLSASACGSNGAEQAANTSTAESVEASSEDAAGTAESAETSLEDASNAYAQWDGNWTCDELSAAAQELFTAEENQYFISWATGTIEPVSGGMGASGSFGGPSGSDESGSFAGPGGSGEFSGPGGSDESGSFAGPGGSGEFAGPGGPAGTDSGLAASGMSGMNSSSYHMASFDYAYNCVAVMEWLFAQKS